MPDSNAETRSPRASLRLSPADAVRIARETATALIEAFPDVADDPDAFLGTLDGECDALDVAERLVKRALEREELAEEVAYLLAQKKEAADALRERKGRFERQAQRLFDGALEILQACQVEGGPKPKLVRAGFTASIRHPAETQRKLLCIDEAQTPDRFKRIVREPDKDAIRAALLAGQDVPGWSLGNSAPSLAVRVK